MAEAPLVEVERVAKKFCRDLDRSARYGLVDLFAEAVGRRRPEVLRPGEFWALEEVSFTLERGEALAVIGPNGAGKSTLLRLVAGRLGLDRGRIVVRGEAAAIGDLGIGFDPLATGRDNARHAATLLGLDRRESERQLEAILAFAELGELAEAPLGTYSTGMRARLGFAVAAHLAPDVLLVDEALAVGDLAFRRKCMQHMASLPARGRALLIVSHDLYAVQVLCPRALYLDRGRVAALGPTQEVVGAYFEARQGDLVRALPAAETPGASGPAAADGRAAGPFRIESLSIEPLGRERIETGGAARVVLRYVAERDLEPVAWGFQVCGVDLAAVLANGIGATEADGVRLTAGRGELSCEIPRLPLFAGRYALRGGLIEPWTRGVLALSGFEDAPGYFSIATPRDERHNLGRLSGALVLLETEATRSRPLPEEGARRVTGGR